MSTNIDSTADLSGTVALVAGATRGGGRAIAIELGRAGSTVVVTGRSTESDRPAAYSMVLDATGLDELPGSVEGTVDEVVAAGGSATGVVCDHADPAQVRDLIGRIRGEHGRLDVLVNNVWGGHEFFDDSVFGAPMWEQPLEQWDAMFDHGVRNQIVTLQAAAPLMIETTGRLIVAPTFFDQGRYLSGNVFYELAKSAINRLAFAAASELRDHRIASIALSPGFMRTELVLAHMGVTEETYAQRPELAGSESPHYLGRAVVALAGDADVLSYSGEVLVVADLARRYGFTDIDGTQPEAFTVTQSSPVGG